jgi:hypothetical protein
MPYPAPAIAIVLLSYSNLLPSCEETAKVRKLLHILASIPEKIYAIYKQSCGQSGHGQNGQNQSGTSVICSL